MSDVRPGPRTRATLPGASPGRGVVVFHLSCHISAPRKSTRNYFFKQSSKTPINIDFPENHVSRDGGLLRPLYIAKTLKKQQRQDIRLPVGPIDRTTTQYLGTFPEMRLELLQGHRHLFTLSSFSKRRKHDDRIISSSVHRLSLCTCTPPNATLRSKP